MDFLFLFEYSSTLFMTHIWKRYKLY